MQTADAKNDELADDLQLGPLLPEEEIPAGKLDDAEIARLVMLSSHADYHRTDNIPVKPKEAFQPRTLVTIAMEAQRRRENEQEAAAHRQAVNDAGGDAGTSDAIGGWVGGWGCVCVCVCAWVGGGGCVCVRVCMCVSV